MPYLRSTTDFWMEVDTLFSTAEAEEPASLVEVEATFELLFSLVEEDFLQHVPFKSEVDALARHITDSRYCHVNHANVRHVVCEAVLKSQEPLALLLSMSIVLELGRDDAGIFAAFHSTSHAFVYNMVHRIWAGHYAAQSEQADVQKDWDPGLLPRNGHAREVSASSTTSNISEKASSSTLSRRLCSHLRWQAIDLLFQVCKVQKLDVKQLRAIDGTFINHLFDLVEATRDHEHEEFNYTIIQLIIALNEQYMVSSVTGSDSSQIMGSKGISKASKRPVNLVLNVLKVRLNASKTFGENLIFMLNRTSSRVDEDLCVQLLILKLLYLLVTTKETAYYFYTNDLKVLVDIFVRELNDLPDDSETLRHTYLRVLHPLLTNTQLCTYPYKRKEIQHLLRNLLSHRHLREVTPTTERLVERCLKAEWCVALDQGTAAVQAVGGGMAHMEEVEVGILRDGVRVITSHGDAYQGTVKQGPQNLHVLEDRRRVDAAGKVTTNMAKLHLHRRDQLAAPHSAPATPPRRGSTPGVDHSRFDGNLAASWCEPASGALSARESSWDLQGTNPPHPERAEHSPPAHDFPARNGTAAANSFPADSGIEEELDEGDRPSDIPSSSNASQFRRRPPPPPPGSRRAQTISSLNT